jgi:hypothetical protein
VAAFHFTALPNSYAARTGRPDTVGLIGVAVFREKTTPPPPPAYPVPRHDYPYSSEGAAAAPRAESEAMGDAAPANRSREAAQAQKSAPAAPRLGTGHGERETSYSSTTRFDRRSNRPDEVITLRYDSRDNLVAMGVIPAYGPQPPVRPDAFPEAPNARFVPDPPSRWR